MASPPKLDRFDPYVPRKPWVNPWQALGAYRSDLTLLRTLLGVAVGTSQQSGVVAGAVDVWAAEELRRAGFDADEVWPRRTAPRVMPRDVRNFVNLALTQKLRKEVEARFPTPGARKALPAEAHAMGSAYSKQSDVVVASWAAGVELLVSTKTMLSSYQKNLRNRFEEGYGDAKNLRGRHPLASLGFIFVTGADIPDKGLEFAIDMLQKLTTEPDVYDCACLLVVEGAQGLDEPVEDSPRPVEDEPAALLSLDDSDVVPDEPEAGEDGTAAVLDDPGSSITVRSDAVPESLGPDLFFEHLITGALHRMPVTVYPEVRKRRASP
jgi:hypothetical protein